MIGHDKNKQELKPCPFCGYDLPYEEGIITETDVMDLESGEVLSPTGVCCSNCGAYQVGGDTDEEAVKNWNTRTDTELQAHNRAMVEALEQIKRIASYEPQDKAILGCCERTPSTTTDIYKAEQEVIEAALILNDNVREDSWPRNGDELVAEPRGANSTACITVKARKMIKLRKAVVNLEQAKEKG